MFSRLLPVPWSLAVLQIPVVDILAPSVLMNRPWAGTAWGTAWMCTVSPTDLRMTFLLRRKLGQIGLTTSLDS